MQKNQYHMIFLRLCCFQCHGHRLILIIFKDLKTLTRFFRLQNILISINMFRLLTKYIY
ncbi:hypothetical protein HanRHA438_Chr16g0787991 [Helianthus annuus]|nr:hypothetical protein HanRHA438_Chr16g0787991 [Helianthus annuus]